MRNTRKQGYVLQFRLSDFFAIALLIVLSFTARAQLPDPGMDIDPVRTAVLITDPQNDFLSPEGVAWGVVGKSVTANNTVENIEALMNAAKANNLPVFISPHYYYPTDHGWKFEGALERLMHNIGMFDRKGALSLDGFEGSGADWLERYKPLINDGKTKVIKNRRSKIIRYGKSPAKGTSGCIVC